MREALEKAGITLNAEDRKIAARPTQAGEYTKPWDAYCTVQCLFKEELDELDELSRDKKDKSNFGACTKALREWWSTLSKEKKDEAEAVTKKWNESGANKAK